MASQNSTGTVAAVHRLKHEIDKLTAEQGKALRSATFAGMTTAEAHKYEERREKITLLVRQLVHIEEANPPSSRHRFI